MSIKFECSRIVYNVDCLQHCTYKHYGTVSCLFCELLASPVHVYESAVHICTHITIVPFTLQSFPLCTLYKHAVLCDCWPLLHMCTANAKLIHACVLTEWRVCTVVSSMCSVYTQRNSLSSLFLYHTSTHV